MAEGEPDNQRETGWLPVMASGVDHERCVHWCVIYFTYVKSLYACSLSGHVSELYLPLEQEWGSPCSLTEWQNACRNKKSKAQ